MRCYTDRYRFLTESDNSGGDYLIKPSQGDGWKIVTRYGYIDYRHSKEANINEIWWVESYKRGHGSQLVDLMQKNHPADSIAWGATSLAGERLMEKWHKAHPEIECITGDHEGQFNPFDSDYSDDSDNDDEIDGLSFD